MYKFIQTINRARKATDSASQPQIERYVDAEIFAFSRGFLFAAFSSKLDRSVHKVITYHPYAEGIIKKLFQVKLFATSSTLPTVLRQ